ncbi:hypothetical protein ZHAS_00006617 [Anopheles sinensis]|uniref:Uncharacterized protein n=1 Tax=Anopheles sinensis TaxID=74873 RepID=A0A084VMS2_ANOSI|nr:hypothetical protein ZHAS_00006617 [Anopheles sinensis]
MLENTTNSDPNNSGNRFRLFLVAKWLNQNSLRRCSLLRALMKAPSARGNEYLACVRAFQLHLAERRKMRMKNDYHVKDSTREGTAFRTPSHDRPHKNAKRSLSIHQKHLESPPENEPTALLSSMSCIAIIVINNISKSRSGSTVLSRFTLVIPAASLSEFIERS